MNQINIILILAFCCGNIFAQSDSLKKDNVNVELLGPSGYGSINYGRIFKIDNKAFIELSLGGIYTRKLSWGVSQFTVLLGSKHFVEFGYAISLRWEQGGNNDGMSDLKSLRLGYRYQRLQQGGFMFRAGFTPLLNFKFWGKEFILPFVGYSAGYSF